MTVLSKLENIVNVEYVPTCYVFSETMSSII